MRLDTYDIPGSDVHMFHAGPADEAAIVPEQLLFVHGGGRGTWEWMPMMTHFASLGYASDALEWRRPDEDGSGLSRDDHMKRGLADVGRQEVLESVVHLTRQIAEQDSAKRLVAIGHGMGALALEAAMAELHESGGHEESIGRIAGMVLIGGVSSAEPGNKFAPAGVFGWAAAKAGRPVILPVPLNKLLYFNGLDADESKIAQSRTVAESPQAVLEAAGWRDVPISAESVLSAVPSDRILTVAGQKDRVVKASAVRRNARHYSAAYHVVPGSGHDALIYGKDYWPQTARIMGRFIQSI